VSHPEVKVKSG